MVLRQPRGSTTRSKCHLPATVTRPCACAWMHAKPRRTHPVQQTWPGRPGGRIDPHGWGPDHWADPQPFAKSRSGSRRQRFLDMAYTWEAVGPWRAIGP